jgi:hypothetical protein
MPNTALKRILAGIVLLIATSAFLVNAAGFVGIWVVRQPARDTITALSTFVNDKLGMIDQTLGRVSARADEGSQAVVRVNDAANKLGDRLDEGSPMVTALTAAVGDNLAPTIADMRVQASALHDAAVAVNTALQTLDRVGFMNVPTFSDELSDVSKRIDAVQSDVQELHATIDEARTVTSANLVAAVRTRTTKIDNVMGQIKSTAVKYQATVAQKQQQVTDLSQRVLRAGNLLVISLTALFLVVAAGQMLLIYICWQYFRRGRLPSLRVA